MDYTEEQCKKILLQEKTMTGINSHDTIIKLIKSIEYIGIIEFFDKNPELLNYLTRIIFGIYKFDKIISNFIVKIFPRWMENKIKTDGIYLVRLEEGYLEGLSRNIIENEISDLDELLKYDIINSYCFVGILNASHKDTNLNKKYSIIKDYVKRSINNEDDLEFIMDFLDKIMVGDIRNFHNNYYKLFVEEVNKKLKINMSKIFNKLIQNKINKTGNDYCFINPSIVSYCQYCGGLDLDTATINKITDYIMPRKYFINLLMLGYKTSNVTLAYYINNLTKEQLFKFLDNYNLLNNVSYEDLDKYEFTVIYRSKEFVIKNHHLAEKLIVKHIENKTIEPDEKLVEYLINNNIIFNDTIKWIITNYPNCLTDKIVNLMIQHKNLILISHAINSKYILNKKQIDLIFLNSMCFDEIFNIIFSQYLEKNKENLSKWLLTHYNFEKPELLNYIKKFNLTIDNSFVDCFVDATYGRPDIFYLQHNETFIKQHTKINPKIFNFYKDITKNTNRYTLTMEKLYKLLEKNKKLGIKINRTVIEMLYYGNYYEIADELIEKYNIEVDYKRLILFANNIHERIKLIKKMEEKELKS